MLMTQLQCQKCNYKFESAKKEVLICPYCGAKGTVKEVPSAVDLLHDVEKDENFRASLKKKEASQ